jgi:hypothetical protein
VDPSPLAFAPGVWRSTDGEISVTINEDGTGNYVNLPRWDGGVFTCNLAGAEPQTDSFTWWYAQTNDQVVFTADHGAPSDVFLAGEPRLRDWRTMAYLVCIPDLPGAIILARED